MKQESHHRIVLDRVKCGQWLARWRNRTGNTQGEVAELIDLHQSTISAIEKGRQGYSVDVILVYATFADMPIDVWRMLWTSEDDAVLHDMDYEHRDSMTFDDWFKKSQEIRKKLDE